MSTELTPVMRRSMLIAMLRDETLWPDGFRWDFAYCTHCAIGMYLAATGRDWTSNTDSIMVADALGLSLVEAQEVLMEIPGRNRFCATMQDYAAITPAIIADRLEALHKQKGQS